MSTRASAAKQLILTTERNHNYPENVAIQLVLKMKMSVEKNTNSSNYLHYSPEEILSFNAGVVSPNEIKLVNGVTGEAERNMTVLLHAKNM